jgi:hypothetical protein
MEKGKRCWQESLMLQTESFNPYEHPDIYGLSEIDLQPIPMPRAGFLDFSG